MTRIPACLAALGCAALVSISTDARALATATASMSSFYIQVFDLDPTDGIVAGVSFSSGASVYAYAADSAGSNGLQNSAALGGAVSTSAKSASSISLALLTAGNAYALGSGPSGLSFAAAIGAGSQSYAYGNVVSSSFTITPHTLLVLSASGDASFSVSTAGDSAYAALSLNLYAQDNSQSSQGSIYAGIDAAGNRYSSLGHPVTASFANLGAAALTGQANGQVYVGVSGAGQPTAAERQLFAVLAPSAVPEPGTRALLLAGGLLGFALAGRRSAAAVRTGRQAQATGVGSKCSTWGGTAK